MADITTTTAAVFIPEVWSAETLRAQEAALVVAPLVKRYDSLVKGRGDTVHIPQVSNLVANDKVANTDVTLQSPTESEKTISIDKWKEASFLVEDVVKVQSNYDLMAEYTNKAGYAIAQQIDTDLLALYTTFTNTDVGTYGTDMGDDEIVGAIQALDEANAPIEDRAMIIKPSQKAAIMKLDKFVRADYLGQYQNPTPVKRGPNNRYLWGEIYGVPVYYTTQVPVTAGTPNETHNMLIHKEALTLALQLSPRTQGTYWQRSLGWLVTVDTIYGVAGLRNDFGVEIRS
jgi:N4-gp56 family major capsid protein